jgi:hypothetical protein
MADIDALVQRLDELEREQQRLQQSLQSTQDSLQSVERARDDYRALYQQMLERCRKLDRGLLGQKAERLPADESQLSLEILASVLGEQASELPQAVLEGVRAHRRGKPTGRKVLPDEIPRVDIEIVPDEVQRSGLDAFERIGQDTSEVLEHRPSSMVVVRHADAVDLSFELDGPRNATGIGARHGLIHNTGIAQRGITSRGSVPTLSL